MNKILSISSFLLLSICVSSAALAETYYVKDELYVTMRTGKGTEYQILKTIRSGTKLEAIEISEEDGYTKVRTVSGVEGWVRSQYLVDQPTAELKLKTAEQKLERVSQENSKLKKQFDEVKGKTGDLSSKQQQLSKENERIKKELAHAQEVAKKPLQLAKENKAMSESNLAMEKELQMLRQENQMLQDRGDREWFMIGAGVMLFGMLLGVVFSKVRGKRGGDWA